MKRPCKKKYLLIEIESDVPMNFLRSTLYFLFVLEKLRQKIKVRISTLSPIMQGFPDID